MHIIESTTYLGALNNIRDIDLGTKTIIITGATGMIGSCLVDALAIWNRSLSNPCHIVAVSRNVETARERFAYCWDEPYFTYIEQDISEEIQDFPTHVDYIIHAASNADPVSFAKSPVDILLANVVGTDLLLKYGCQHGMKRFLYISSGEMYGQPDEQQSDFLEKYCGPVDHHAVRACYPVGKRAAEVLCQCYIKQFQADAVIVRPCHIFGPTMTMRDSRAVSEFFRNAVKGIDIGLKSSGLVERSHCYVVDAVSAIFTVMKNGVCGEAYNIADKGYQMTILKFAESVASASGCKVFFENPSDIEVQGYSKISRAVLSSKKLEALGWKSQSEGLSAISQTVNILREVRKR